MGGEEPDDDAMNDAVRLRPERPDDEAFLRRLYASTRVGEPVLSSLPPEQRESFLRMQFDARRRSYAATFPNASYDVIVIGEHAIGRLCVNRTDEEIRIVDIALLPERRGRGDGGALVRELMEEAKKAGRPLVLSVEIENHGARRFYERLGFRPCETNGPHLRMVWNRPDSA